MSQPRRVVLLMCPASPGFVYPCIRIGKCFQSAGSRAIVCTGDAFARSIVREGLEFYEHRFSDHCFEISSWYLPEYVAKQFKILVEAIRLHGPEILIVSQHCPAYVLLEDFSIQTWVLGLATSLWPRRICPSTECTDRELRENWRLAEWQKIVSEAARLLETTRHRIDVSTFYGNKFLLRSVPELDPMPSNSWPQFSYIGDCLYEPDVDESWRAFANKLSKRVIYIQHGRHFDRRDFWTELESVFSKSTEFIYIADMERYDGAKPSTHLPIHFRRQVPLLTLIPNIDVIVSSGGSTSVLAAISSAKKLIMSAPGSGAEDLSELVRTQELGRVFDFTPTDPQTVASIQEFLSAPIRGEFQQTIAKAFQQRTVEAVLAKTSL